jgi:glycosyltransferase involved in cell wall biosynthesis
VSATYIGWGALPPPVHGTSLMNKATAEVFNSLGSLVWVDPSGAKTQRDIKRPLWRQVILGTVALARFAWRLARARDAQSYLAISVAGPAFIRDVFAWTLAVLLSRHRPVVHLHTGRVQRLTSGIAALAWVRWLLARSEVWVLAERFAREVAAICHPKVIENGVACSSGAHDDRMAERMRSAVSSIRVTYLSNRHPSKGAVTAMRVCRRLLEEGGDRSVFVTFAGCPMDSEVEAALAGLAADYRSNVKVLNGVGPDEKCLLLSETDVFLFPSRYPLEGAPLVLLEALMHGAYCIVTDHAAMPEIVGPSGGVVDDEGGIVRAIEAYCALSEGERRAVAERAIERWRSNFTPERYGQRVSGLVAGSVVGE